MCRWPAGEGWSFGLSGWHSECVFYAKRSWLCDEFLSGVLSVCLVCQPEGEKYVCVRRYLLSSFPASQTATQTPSCFSYRHLKNHYPTECTVFLAKTPIVCLLDRTKNSISEKEKLENSVFLFYFSGLRTRYLLCIVNFFYHQMPNCLVWGTPRRGICCPSIIYTMEFQEEKRLIKAPLSLLSASEHLRSSLPRRPLNLTSCCPQTISSREETQHFCLQKTVKSGFGLFFFHEKKHHSENVLYFPEKETEMKRRPNTGEFL